MFQRVMIVGVGLLGASIGLAIKQRLLATTVIGVGRSGSDSIRIAVERDAIDEGFSSIVEALEASKACHEIPDLIILCTPVRQFRTALDSLHAANLPATTLITDVGSTKAQVMTWAAEVFSDPHGPTFIGSHPMAGSEKRGPEAARDTLFENALCLLCTPADPASASLATVQKFWHALGMRTHLLDAHEHDRWVATVSHLPHAVAYSLMNTAAATPERLSAAAGGLLDTTRIAGSDVDMWTDIFLTNAPAVSETLDTFAAEFESLRNAIASADESAIRRFLTRGKAGRETLLATMHAVARANAQKGKE